MSLYDDETEHARKSEFMTGAFAVSTVGGQDASFQIIIPDDGFHGLVVWKVSSRDYSKSQTYRIAVGPPALTVLAPNGGETWNVGNLYYITWDAFGNLGHPVKIELSRDSGSTWSTLTSRCIDRGDPTSDWTAELWPHGQRINMGAYGGTPEASKSPSTVGNPADFNHDGFVDELDMRLFSFKWLIEEVLLPEDLNSSGFVDFFDYAIFGNEWGWEAP